MLIKLNVDVDPDYTVPLNAELFEWVIENLLKNALDALGSDQGSITLDASSGERHHSDRYLRYRKRD